MERVQDQTLGQPPAAGQALETERVQQARRRMLGWLGMGLAAPVLGGCAVAPGGSTALSDRGDVDAAAELQLLYFADTLDSRAPSWPSLPDVRLGPATRIGSAPWLTGRSALAQLPPGPWQTLYEPTAAATPMGGYAALAALLEMLKRQHPEALTLENGQCWNGSGLAHLTRGRSGVDGSRMLGSEVRVCSDERLLWPEQAAGLYREAAIPVLGASLDESRQKALGVQGWTLFQRAGVRIAVVGVTDPYAADERASLKEWFERVDANVQQARKASDLLILLADVGTGPAIWLAERLEGVDLILAARGQDLWPQLLSLRNPQGVTVPLCLPGCRALGAFSIQARRQAGAQPAAWQFEAQFIPAQEQVLDAAARARLPQLQQQLTRQRAAHADWLDQPLARAPAELWRRDLFGGSWDRIIHDALAGDLDGQAFDGQTFDGEVLLPGLRYDLPLAAGAWITRDHLFALTGSYEARLQTLDASLDTFSQLLEQRADEAFGEPLLLDTSRDLPRLLAAHYRLNYAAGRGQRIAQLQLDSGRTHFPARTFALQGATDGVPLWQRLEAYLRSRPADWQLGPLQRPQLAFVEGHPGWHPRALPASDR